MGVLKEFPQYNQNPFRIDKDAVRYITDVVVKKDGENKVYKSRVVMADFQGHVRVFRTLLQIVPRLSGAGLKVLCYIWADVLSSKNDEVNLNMNIMSIGLGIRNRGYLYNGVRELIEWSVIARKMDINMYFINPFLFYGGSRAVWWLKYKEMNGVGRLKPDDIQRLVDVRISGQPKEETN